MLCAADSQALASEPGHGQLLAGKSKSTAKHPKNFSGNASWYGVPFHGRKTACGETFDMNKMTAAHLKLPFHTKVLVEDPKTGKSIVIRVTDRVHTPTAESWTWPKKRPDGLAPYPEEWPT
ncbi:MAG: hypothetical protein HC888_10245 [Candidatus Competibacteraceae bacterium]|nr:hypothetical protein [Candidatus Competibacteraceae bacterium]